MRASWTWACEQVPILLASDKRLCDARHKTMEDDRLHPGFQQFLGPDRRAAGAAGDIPADIVGAVVAALAAKMK
jgi:hypothetical protein